MYSNGPKIVTNGLFSYLDAGNPKSYPGSGTTWTDISRNGGSATLTNGPTFSAANGGSLLFDGANDVAISSGPANLAISNASIICWMYRDGNQQQYQCIYSGGFDLIFHTGNQMAYSWAGNYATYGWNSGMIPPNLEWCMMALSVTGAVSGNTPATLYLFQKSGITSAINNVGHSPITIGSYYVASAPTGARYFKGNIANLQVYNRALSRDEIFQNYNATKGRFKL